MLFRGALAVSLLLVGCAGGTTHTRQRPEGPVTIERLFPLAHGLTWTYRIQEAGGEARGHQITRVVLQEGPRFMLRSGLSVWRIERDAPGLWRIGDTERTGTWLLQEPLEVGHTWPGREGATVSITAMDQTVTVPAGTFERCVRTLETEGDDGARLETVYCPDVGPVRVEAWQGARSVRLGELVAWGQEGD